MAPKGTYTLILRLRKNAKIKVGALGEIEFLEGFYAYTGSALGSGGLKRVARHGEVASGERKTRKWHIDFLLPRAEIVESVISGRGRPVGVYPNECEVANKIGERATPVIGFGCTDCNCRSHLHFSDDLETLREEIRMAHGTSGSIKIKSKRPNDILNEIKWKNLDLSKCELCIIHRGAPSDSKIINGNEITEIGKGFFVIDETMIPYHRVLSVKYDGVEVWRKKCRK
jgi:Uri superfamily endonuclease/uncharacterized protein (UPF0248 family)